MGNWFYHKDLFLVFQLHGELDELHRHLEARRGQYGSSLSNVIMTSQAFKQFELTVQVSTPSPNQKWFFTEKEIVGAAPDS